ncbi:MAG: protein translocase subunit SecD, partial [Streptomycetales bacterium]
PPAPTPAPAPGQGPGQPANGQPAGEIPPDVQRDLVQLDCTKQENRQGSSLARPDEPVVACERDGIAKYLLGPAAVKGTDLSGASAQLPQQGASGGWFVSLTFDDQGTRAFAETTSQLSGQSPPRNQFAIVLDGLVVSAPQVNETIPGGQAQITGSFSQKESQDLASVLKYGALPLAFEKSEVNQISPTLSGDQLTGGLIAGALGLALVVVYSLLYYRGLGTVTVLSLIVAAAITYATAVLLGTAMGWTLTLAGIAGLIVAIGITADSFVVFFERLRDEVREGRSLRAAVEHGWVRARRTIIAADFVSFLAAAVLYILSVGTVRGFAFALGLTTLIDVLVVFLFTKPLVTLFAGTKFFGRGHPLSGLDPVRLGAKPGATSPFRHRAREI